MPPRAERPANRFVIAMADHPDLAALLADPARATIPDRALFDAGAALGFPRLPIRPSVSVIAGREAWERFTANGTEEDLTAARIAVAARLAAKAHRGSLAGADTGAAPSRSPDGEKAQLAQRCAFCGAFLVRRRRHARHCSGRCRAAASDRRRADAAPSVSDFRNQAPQERRP